MADFAAAFDGDAANLMSFWDLSELYLWGGFLLCYFVHPFLDVLLSLNFLTLFFPLFLGWQIFHPFSVEWKKNRSTRNKAGPTSENVGGVDATEIIAIKTAYSLVRWNTINSLIIKTDWNEPAKRERAYEKKLKKKTSKNLHANIHSVHNSIDDNNLQVNWILIDKVIVAVYYIFELSSTGDRWSRGGDTLGMLIDVLRNTYNEPHRHIRTDVITTNTRTDTPPDANLQMANVCCERK